MADNKVAVVISSKDEAKPDLDMLKAKLESIGHEVETARVDVDDADARARIAALQLRLDRLGHTVENPKLTVTGGRRAEVEMMKIEAALHKVPGAVDEAGKSLERLPAEAAKAGEQSGDSFIKKFGSFLAPGKFQLITSGVTSALAALPALAGGAGALAGIGFAAAFLVGTKKSQGPLYSSFHNMLAGLKTTVMGALAPMIGPLKQAFASIGSFVKSIGPELKQVFAAIAPTVMPFTHALESLVRGILPGFLAMMKAVRPAVTALGQLLGGLGKDLGGMFKAFAPAMKASGDVIKMLGSVLNGLLPVIGRLAASLAKALGPVLESFGKAIKALAPGLEVVGKILGKLAGAVISTLAGALMAIAKIIQHLAPGFETLAKVLGRVFTAMENNGVFGTLEDAVESLAAPLGKLIGLLVSGLAPIAGQLLTALAQLSASIGSALISAVVAVLPPVIQIVRILLKFLGEVIRPLLPALMQLARALVQILAAVLPILSPLLKLTAVLLQLVMAVLTPLLPLLAGVVKIVALFATGLALAVGWVVKIVSAAISWVVHFARVHHVISHLVDWIKSHWPLLLSVLTGPIGLAVLFITRHWHEITSGAARMSHSVAGFFEGLPHRILSALGDVGHLLWDAGAKIIQGLINGIKSAIGGVGHIMGSVADEIKSFLPFSPAKKGPLSGAGAPEKSGAAIAANLARGMRGGLGSVSAAAAHMAGAAGGGYGAARGGAGGVLRIEWDLRTGGSRIMDALAADMREHARVNFGGSAQAAFGYGGG